MRDTQATSSITATLPTRADVFCFDLAIAPVALIRKRNSQNTNVILCFLALLHMFRCRNKEMGLVLINVRGHMCVVTPPPCLVPGNKYIVITTRRQISRYICVWKHL